MLTITTIMRKGGSGKTTLTRALATAALSKGQKVHIFDMDTDRQAHNWKERFEAAPWSNIPKPSWSEQITISGGFPDIEQLYDKLSELDQDGYGLALLDTRPGANIETEDHALAADAVLIPTRPLQTDFPLAVQTVEWMQAIVGTLENTSDAPIFRTVLTSVPNKIVSVLIGDLDISAISAFEREVIETLVELPHTDNVIQQSKYWEQIGAWGPLNFAAEAAASQPSSRLQARMMRDQILAATELLDEISEAVRERKQ